MRKVTTTVAALAAMTLFGVGCASHHQENVTSDYLSQSTMVDADVETVSNAAKKVFMDDKLTDVSEDATKVDGRISGMTADKTKIQATVTKTDTGVKLTISVGKVGDPKMGADYAVKIKQVAEGMKMKM